jgi:hypothetical protein
VQIPAHVHVSAERSLWSEQRQGLADSLQHLKCCQMAQQAPVDPAAGMKARKMKRLGGDGGSREQQADRHWACSLRGTSLGNGMGSDAAVPAESTASARSYGWTEANNNLIALAQLTITEALLCCYGDSERYVTVRLGALQDNVCGGSMTPVDSRVACDEHEQCDTRCRAAIIW